MTRLGSLFIREVNVAIVGLIAATVIVAGAHYVSVVHEIQHLRRELCSARLEVITRRNTYLKGGVEPADTCATLAALTGQPVTPARSVGAFATTRMESARRLLPVRASSRRSP